MTMNVFAELAELDPAIDAEAQPDWAAMAPVLLASLDERTMPMQTQERVDTPHSEEKRTKGWLIAAAAFVVLLLAGLVATLSLGSATEPPVAPPVPTTTIASDEQIDNAPEAAPTTTLAAATTTTTPPEPSAADLAFAEDLADAYNAEDIDRYMALLPPDVTFPSGAGESVSSDQIRTAAAVWWDLDQRLDLETCRITSSGSTACRYSVSDAFSDAVGFPEPWVTVTFNLEEGVAVDYVEAWSNATHVEYLRILRNWFDENKPGEPRPLEFGFRDYGRFGHLLPEDPALILRYLNEFAASQ